MQQMYVGKSYARDPGSAIKKLISGADVVPPAGRSLLFQVFSDVISLEIYFRRVNEVTRKDPQLLFLDESHTLCKTIN